MERKFKLARKSTKIKYIENDEYNILYILPQGRKNYSRIHFSLEKKKWVVQYCDEKGFVLKEYGIKTVEPGTIYEIDSILAVVSSHPLNW